MFYIRGSWAMLKVFHFTLGWLDISRFSNSHVHCRNLWICEPSWGIMENFQGSSALPNIKYNCVVLFLSKLYLLCIYASKYFLIDHHCKSQTEFSDLLAKGKIYWCSHRVYLFVLMSASHSSLSVIIQMLADKTFLCFSLSLNGLRKSNKFNQPPSTHKKNLYLPKIL